jgi:ferrous iron transport protein B
MRRIVLIGGQNAGKSTLFNAITTGRAEVANYSGSTVEFRQASLRPVFGLRAMVSDTPGIISLHAPSPDQRVAVEHLYSENPDLVVAVVDATQLARHLHLVRQLQRAGFPLLLVVTMADRLSQHGERLDLAVLQQALGLKALMIDNHDPDAGRQVAAAIAEHGFGSRAPAQRLAETAEAELQAEFAGLDALVAPCLQQISGDKLSRRDPDRVLLHPVFGLVGFALIMSLLFASVFSMASPFMEFIGGFFGALVDHIKAPLEAIEPVQVGEAFSKGLESGFGACGSWIGAQLCAFLDLLQFGKVLSTCPAWVTGFLADGLVGGLGMAFTFLPQIFILFLIIGLLEDSGYLARGAMLIDKPLSLIGLNGRSFVPMLSGFACAIPAMMAARTIRNPGERLLTVFIVPLMSCSARLPVYGLFIYFLFKDSESPALLQGLAMAGLYFFSLMLGSVAAALLSRLPTFRSGRSALQLELPELRLPLLRVVWMQLWQRASQYLRKATPTITAISSVLWLLTHLPYHEGKNEGEVMAGSYAADIGRHTEFLVEPMGLDWRGSVALASGFAARETFIAALQSMYQVDVDENDEEEKQTLRTVEALSAAKFPDGRKIFTVSTCVGLLLFFTMALQCFPTVAVARNEFGGWKLAILQLVAYTGGAWLLSIALVQTLRACGVE